MEAGSAVAEREMTESAAIALPTEASAKDDAIDSLWEDGDDVEIASSQVTQEPQKGRRILARTLTTPNRPGRPAISPVRSSRVSGNCDMPNQAPSRGLRKALTINSRTLGSVSAPRPPTGSPARSFSQIGSSSSSSKLERRGFGPSSSNRLAGRRVSSFSDARGPTGYFQSSKKPPNGTAPTTTSPLNSSESIATSSASTSKWLSPASLLRSTSMARQRGMFGRRLSRTTSDGREPRAADVAAGQEDVSLCEDVAGMRLDYGGGEEGVPNEAGEEDGVVTSAFVKQASMSVLETRSYRGTGHGRSADKGADTIDPNLRDSDAIDPKARPAGVSAAPESARQSGIDADMARPATDRDEIPIASPADIDDGADQKAHSLVMGLESSAMDVGSDPAVALHRRSNTLGGAETKAAAAHPRYQLDGHASPRMAFAKSPLYSVSPSFHSRSPRLVVLKRSTSYHLQERSGSGSGNGGGNSGGGGGSTSITRESSDEQSAVQSSTSVPRHQRSRSCLDMSWKDGPKGSSLAATSPSATVTFIPSFNQRRTMASAALHAEPQSPNIHEEASWKDRSEQVPQPYPSSGYHPHQSGVNHGGNSSSAKDHHHQHHHHHSYNSRPPPVRHHSPYSTSSPSEEEDEEEEDFSFSSSGAGLHYTSYNTVPEDASWMGGGSDAEHGGCGSAGGGTSGGAGSGSARQLRRRASETGYLRGIRDVEARLEAVVCSGPLDLEMVTSAPGDEMIRRSTTHGDGVSVGGGYGSSGGGLNSNKGGGGGGAGGGAMHPPPSRPPRASNPTRASLRRATSARPSQAALW